MAISPDKSLAAQKHASLAANATVDKRLGIWVNKVGCPGYTYAMGNEELFRLLNRFVEDRDWDQFHTPQNLAKSIAIEAAELLELFQWSDKADEDLLSEELADVLTYCYLLAQKIGKDPESLILEKLRITEMKYPAEKSRGRSIKYDKL